jgi:hypothetical protein
VEEDNKREPTRNEEMRFTNCRHSTLKMTNIASGKQIEMRDKHASSFLSRRLKSVKEDSPNDGVLIRRFKIT